MVQKLKRNLFLTLTTVAKGFSESMLLYLFVLALFIYVLAYGMYVTDGVRDTDFGVLVLVIFVPILLIDVFKTLVECNSPIRLVKGFEETDKVTVIIPTMNGGDTIEETLIHLLRKFPAQNIIVASNGSTDDTCVIAGLYGVRVLEIPKAIGKIDAINEALSMVTTEYCLTMDDDVLIKNATIPTGLLRDSTGVAFRVFPSRTNWLTQLQMHEYRKSMDVGKNFHNSTKTVQNISGAIGLFHTEELLRQKDLHTGEFSGEDLQRTLLIHLGNNNNGTILSDSIVETDVPNTVASLFKQRVFGWGPGLLNNLGNLFKLIFKKDIPLKLRYEAFYTIFLVLVMDPIRLIALPIIIYYPELALLVYLTYVILEAVPYFKLKAKEPLWVLFAMPIYGLFMFIARVTATLVFLYRRTAVIITGKPRRDDYRTVGFGGRIISIVLSVIIFISAITLVAYNVKPIVLNELPVSEIVKPDKKYLTTKPQSIWLWQSPIAMDASDMEEELSFLEKKNITTVYIDITEYIDIYESGDTLAQEAFTARLRIFTEIASSKNIKVEALVGGMIWSDPNYSYVPETILRYVIAFNNDPENTVKISGIQFDVESYSSPQFSFQINQKRILKEYLAMVQSLTLIVETESPELRLGFAVPFWFDGVSRDLPEIVIDNKVQSVGFHVIDILDSIENGYIVIMDYRNQTAGVNGSIELARPQLDYAKNNAVNTKVIIAQETTDVEPASITFFNKTELDLNKALYELERAFSGNERFEGFAIHDTVGYRDLTQSSVR